jgi:hypothetical protein
MSIEQQNEAGIIWRSVPSYEGVYEVSCFGWIRRVSKASGTQSGRILKDFNNHATYRYITLRVNNIPSNFLVHILVAKVFHPNPMNKPQVNHKDGIKWHNWASNVEWATRAENMEHAAKTGLTPTGEKSHLSKVTAKDVREMRSIFSLGIAQKKIAQIYGLSKGQVNRIVHNINWKQI